MCRGIYDAWCTSERERGSGVGVRDGNRDIDADTSLPGRTIGSQSRAEPRANIVFTRTHGFAVQIIWYYCTYSTYARAKLFANWHPPPLPLLCRSALRAGFQYPFALMLMSRIVCRRASEISTMCETL